MRRETDDLLTLFRRIRFDDSDDDSENEDNTNTENEDPFIDIDYVFYSISTWLDKFVSIMPKTILVDIPQEICKLLLKVDILEVKDNEETPVVQTFCDKLDSAISELGGTAFIKNNWHAPKDASMFSLNNLLKATNHVDVVNYISFSEKLLKDFEKNLGNVSFCVALRPWIDIHPASEFRCIVAHNEVVGITPREWPKYYGHFKEIMPSLVETVNQLFNNHIKNVFEAKNFIFDIIFTSPEQCTLWDFGPLNESTKLYAFQWSEIKSIIEAEGEERPPVFRYLAEDIGIVPNDVSYEQEIE